MIQLIKCIDIMWELSMSPHYKNSTFVSFLKKPLVTLFELNLKHSVQYYYNLTLAPAYSLHFKTYFSSHIFRDIEIKTTVILEKD